MNDKKHTIIVHADNGLLHIIYDLMPRIFQKKSGSSVRASGGYSISLRDNDCEEEFKELQIFLSIDFSLFIRTQYTIVLIIGYRKIISCARTRPITRSHFFFFFFYTGCVLFSH